jgi:hypothetical protein
VAGRADLEAGLLSLAWALVSVVADSEINEQLDITSWSILAGPLFEARHTSNEMSCQDAIPASHTLLRGKCSILALTLNLSSNLQRNNRGSIYRGPSLEYDGRADLGVRLSILSICI